MLTRRQLVERGLAGGALLALAGGLAVASRRGRRIPSPAGLEVFDGEEYSIFSAVAETVLAIEAGAPSPAQVGVARKADALLALAPAADQRDFRRLLHLFENGLAGALSGTGLAPFTASSPASRQARLRAWETSRFPLLRTGFQAMKRLSAACYYASPEAWPAIGYPGPPDIPGSAGGGAPA